MIKYRQCTIGKHFGLQTTTRQIGVLIEDPHNVTKERVREGESIENF